VSPPTTGSPDDHKPTGSPEDHKPTAGASGQTRRWTLGGLARTLRDLCAVLTSAQAVIIAGTAVVAAMIALAAPTATSPRAASSRHASRRLISVSSAQLAEINGSRLPYEGATTLANAQVVSNHQPNMADGQGGSC
jgi:hypothetical protein